MDIAALIIAIVALLLALKAAGGGAARHSELESMARRAQSEAENAELHASQLEQFVKLMASGQAVTAEMIDEGRLYAEVDAAEAKDLILSGEVENLTVVDVRSSSEVEGGHIEGALWIPVENIEDRYREIPREGKVLVVCAVGGRSAAACDFVASKGWANLSNVMGGMSSYTGPVVQGTPSKK